MSRSNQWTSWELAALAAVGLQYSGAFSWVVRTWSDETYQSWGFLALALLVPTLLRLPRRREAPRPAHLVAVLALGLVDLAVAAPLRINVLSAALGLVSLHLVAVSFRCYPGRWFLLPQLWLGLACLPAVFWSNALFGYHLQHLASRLAAAGLGLYGIEVTASGTLLQLPTAVVAVDATCSGLKLLYAGLLFGLVSTPRCSAPRRALYWGCLLSALLAANVVRIISLVVAQVAQGEPVNDTMHYGIGLAAFALVCGGCLLLARRLSAPVHTACHAGAAS